MGTKAKLSAPTPQARQDHRLKRAILELRARDLEILLGSELRQGGSVPHLPLLGWD